MQFLSIIFLFSIFIFNNLLQNAFAQSVPQELQNKFQNIEFSKIDTVTQQPIAKATNTDSSKDTMVIFETTDNIFPKSQVSNAINPAFKRNSFGVNNILKGNTQRFKSSQTYGGTNSQFLAKSSKHVKEKDIPKKMRDLLSK